ncbi:MAG: 23S rRNA (guanosine(2251)-2'-O)-methyltransferase RlmB, partial [Acidobacteria bacterium]
MAILCGINPTLEALKAVDCRVERVCVRRGQRSPRIQELIDLTRTKGIALSFEAREWLDRRSE